MKHCTIIYEVDTYRIHTYLMITIIIHTWHTCVSFVHWLGSDNSEKEKSVQQLLRNLHLVHLSLPCDQVWEVINHPHGWRPDAGFQSFRKQDTPNKNEWFSVFLFSNHHFASKITIYQYINQVPIYIYTCISIYIYTHTLQPNVELMKIS